MNNRSKRADVRNPVLSLPATQKLLGLDQSVKALLRSILIEMQADARSRADKAWRKHKWPMAVYWKAVAVYCGHFARALGRNQA